MIPKEGIFDSGRRNTLTDRVMAAESRRYDRGTVDPSATNRIDETLWLSCVSRASREREPTVRVEYLLRYLETFPTGVHNRAVAEQIEDLLGDVVTDAERERLYRRYRSLRDPYLPPVEPDTWDNVRAEEE